MMSDLATEARIKYIKAKTWKPGELSTYLAMKQAQLKEESFTLASVQGNVKLIKNVILSPLETQQASCITRRKVHRKRLHAGC